MSNAHEFEVWRRIWDVAPPPGEGDHMHPIAEMAWRGMESCVERSEVMPGDIEDAARLIADALPWVAFWIAAGAVLVALIVKGWTP